MEQNYSMHLLVFRFSAMGDVALTVPVIRTVLKENKDLKITLVTNPFYVPFFFGIERLTIYPADFHEEYKGLKGIFRLYTDLKRQAKFDFLIDLHSVIRSWILSLFFRLSGLKLYRIKKGRSEKKKAIRGKSNNALIHTTERYRKVFAQLLSNTDIIFKPGIIPIPENKENIKQFIIREDIPSEAQWIGIAPMAWHTLKMWDLDNFISLIEIINKNHVVSFFMFGGGEEEKEKIDIVSSKFKNTTNTTGKLSLGDEIALISQMSFMITMDSANMHISSRLDVPTVSIWGGTHPNLGFSAVNQPQEFSIQIPETELTCRPCTVFGKGECKRGDLACLKWITPEMVYQKLSELRFFR